MIDLKGNKLILASKSPRRQELLKGLCVDFEVRTKETAEDYPENMPVGEVAAFVSEKKAKAFVGELEDHEILLTSDTVVILDGRVLEKPRNKEEARQMLRSLSANQHTVSTGITLLSYSKTITLQDEASVVFKSLSEEEIDFYIDHFKPFDKAGAYGIQEWIGYIGVKKIEGSFYSVMGLPVHLVYQALKDW
ncbi:Maf family nucleotide pyrophosphatase [Cecembia lonarensis]|uniref:dTTP/UTP pyrophosphatase n=1 Tax=Cecembia lonarensis (strain CCUG 58316 / KCTC 22772 / LW9) TaxID=1225176 RepID=K1L052_CECL9|nr:Maf family nucleotide pyrophosphatase [Cecembia lonarensis]EKB48156.1 Septum formation protein Maf [Cecembia lonarensis LW9]